MALVLKDRVKESSSSSGTGSVTLAGAFTGYQTFASAVANGSTVYYTIHNTTSPNDGEWEVGLGTFTSPATLARTTVLSSSTGGTKVSFSSASTLEVFITQPAEEAIYLNNATGLVEIGGNGTNTVSFTNINTTNLTATTVTLTNGTITTNAANATDITNKQYVDGLVTSGIHFHEPVLVEEDVALVAVYAQPNGASNGVGATLTNNAANAALVVDGVSVSNAARILVYAQANAVQNGVYTVTNPGNASAQWVLTRATDADTFGLTSSDNLGEGSTFFVSSGNTGAGRTYTCNTTGTITFGTTDITFAQISSSQIYAAGTGLNLSNLTFSISNTAVTAATYGDSGNVAQVTVNAQGQLTNAANVAINASSITTGTLPNAQTTANSANGASTIVLRDSTGSFTANTITATDVNSTNVTATTGSFTNISGNAATVTNINASNISSGTLDNARTTGNTANSASTIVLRDTNGSFGANIISGAFSGDGSAINAINASNISSGTIDNSRTSAASANGASTIVQRDSGGNFAAATITAAVIGDLSGGSNINASNIASGTIANARTTANSANGASTIVLRGASGEFAAGAITGTSFSGNGSAITAINASAITTGTLDNARTNATSANGASTLVVRDANGSFAGNVVTGTTGTFTSVSGNGIALTAINASNISSGTVATARISGSYTGITGVGTLVAGTWNATTIAVANGGTGATSAANALTNLGAYAASNPSGYVTTAGARSALSFSAGSGAYNSSTGVMTIPTNTNQLTNGAGFTTNTGTVTSVSGTGSASGLSLSGTVTTSGNLTLSGTVNNLAAGTYGINTTGTFGSATPSFSAYANTGTSINNTTFTKINFQVEEWDTAGNFASSRFTPTTAGYYLIQATVQLNGNPNGGWVVVVYRNGSSYKAGTFLPNANIEPMAHVSAIVSFNGSSDYVEIFGYQSSGGTRSTLASSNYHWFNAAYIRGA
jgi:hypothetical protein